jgi:hypothetical protein
VLADFFKAFFVLTHHSRATPPLPTLLTTPTLATSPFLTFSLSLAATRSPSPPFWIRLPFLRMFRVPSTARLVSFPSSSEALLLSTTARHSSTSLTACLPTTRLSLWTLAPLSRTRSALLSAAPSPAAKSEKFEIYSVPLANLSGLLKHSLFMTSFYSIL